MDEEDESCSFSCEGEPGVLEPDADIAGLGVILGFLITAYLTVALLVAYYVWYFDPNLDPFRASGDDAATTEVPNPVDRVVLLSLRKRNPSDRKNAGAGMEGILNKCIIMFADIQIVTGIAILIGGYSTLPCGISAYHWQLVVDLAWFSSVTHLAALTFLRRYLHNRPVEKWCRVAFMLRLSTGSINDVDNTQTGPQQDVERPAAVAPSPSDYEDILDDYEKSSSFRGALFLAAWFYISLTVYIMTDAPRDIVALFYTLNFEVYVFQPVIQLTWPLWCLWIDKIGSRQRPWETRSLRLLLFLALLETSIYEFFNSSAVEATFLEPGVIAASLLAIYAIFLTWALIRLRARQLEATIGGGTLYHLRSAVLQLVMTCLVMAASLFMIWCYELLEFPGEAWAFLGFIIFVFGACHEPK
ncbi:hypothetical protein B0T18DRAFT_447808 [Schizothecium vesticola]|uniref:Uncharacterized protein n=1 Tax=Schizothecium vesticola TaxID=314040 RepID=A0AA40K1Y6_9PEZI|nr:hypothetical protein B0T18DRAFT_447808 [Schizothecium vesticola]